MPEIMSTEKVWFAFVGGGMRCGFAGKHALPEWCRRDVEDTVPYNATMKSKCRAGTCAPPFH